jgi:hypothetical protein
MGSSSLLENEIWLLHDWDGSKPATSVSLPEWQLSVCCH